MNPYLYLFGFLLIFFVLIPVLINHHPKRVGKYWRDRQYLKAYPMLVAKMLAISSAMANIVLFACFPKSIGIIVSTLIMLSMLHSTYTAAVLSFFRNSTRATCFLATLIIGLAFTQHTFPIAIILGLVQLFSCLLPRRSQREPVATSLSESNEEATSDMEPKTSDEAETTAAESVDDSKESAAATEQETETTPSSSATDSLQQPTDTCEPQRMASSRKTQSPRPNRHSNPSTQANRSKSYRHHHHGNVSKKPTSSKETYASLISLIAFALSQTKDARDQELLRYTSLYKKPKQRNRFQNFFYRLSCKLERARSGIAQELSKSKGMRDDFSNR